MTKSSFSRLNVGASVTLTVSARAYGCGYPTDDGRVFYAPGSTGILGAVKVSNVTGPEGYFHCLDMPEGTPVFDRHGKPVDMAGRKPSLRCAVTANCIA